VVGSGRAVSQPKEVVIGVLYPLSGNAAQVGIDSTPRRADAQCGVLVARASERGVEFFRTTPHDGRYSQAMFDFMKELEQRKNSRAGSRDRAVLRAIERDVLDPQVVEAGLQLAIAEPTDRTRRTPDATLSSAPSSP
jgi:hypothetical protein